MVNESFTAYLIMFAALAVITAIHIRVRDMGDEWFE